MSYKRVKIIRALKEYGFEFLREGGNHTIFTNGKLNIPARVPQTLFFITRRYTYAN
jgi:predicted RNA binding protein YcfA (HicA-like mRNA interferase family)